MSRKRSLFINYDDSDEATNDSAEIVDSGRIHQHSVKHQTESALNWKVEDLAAHLTLISHSIFQELQPCDLKSLKWYNPRMKNHPESARVHEITRRFNYDGQWAVKEILSEEVCSHYAVSP
jgi:hypothetical protein